MKTIVPALALLGLILGGCARSQVSAPGDLDVLEAVFRYQLDHYDSRLQNNPKAFYLCVGENGADPSNELIKRLANNVPPVRKFSDCTTDLGNGVRDNKTHDLGVVLRVVSIQLVSSTEAEVKGGYFEGQGSASGSIYTVQKQDSRWQVTKEKSDWQDRSSTNPAKNP